MAEYRKLLIGTNNRGKLNEFHALLKGLDIQIISPEDAGIHLDVPETGSTYAENAASKAAAFAAAAGFPALADDSGLEVDALDGSPGVHSHRFGPGLQGTDAERRMYLLKELRAQPQPWTARFRCLAAAAAPSGKMHLAEGICEGIIIPEERGNNGFGYDPVFFLPELGKTMAELTMEEKNQLSHRAKAVRAILPALEKLYTSH